MASAASDRNLLIGILALQMEFVDRGQLIAAMNSWVLEKQTPLIEILKRDATLTDSDMELLEAVVSRHVARHDNDVTQSLASLQATATISADLAELADADISGSLAAAGCNETITLSMGMPTSTGQRFDVLRPHARGGLGEVYVARDNELNREVALKKIQPQFTEDQGCRTRFLQEAEITGALEHPGIVPVYGLGINPGDQPYYAMRFIRGETLGELIDRYYRELVETPSAGIEFRKLLQRFLNVCNTIDYAHSRGVVHRDLKPNNIMIGRFGETFVVDWGLAKPIGQGGENLHEGDQHVEPPISSSTTKTQMGVAVGTPQYMSPEQATGRLDRVGVRSDVYSLGATFYYLLTQQPPVDNDSVPNILSKVEKGEIVAPSLVAANCHPALSAICMRAMSRSPKDRYPSCQEFAADIERWLADEPVSVFRESITVRCGRWLRRHKTFVTSTLVASFVLIAMLLVGMVVLAAARDRETAARNVADANFQMARDAIDNYFIRVSEEVLLDQPGMQPVRNELLREALAYYERFLADYGDVPQLRRVLAETLYNQGKILGEIESSEAALKVLRRARAVQSELVMKQPRDLTLKYRLGNTHNLIGSMHMHRRHWQHAADAFGQAEAIRTELVAQFPDNLEYQRKLANTKMNLGLLEMQNESFEAAKQKLEQAQQIRLRILEVDSQHRDVRRDFARGEFNLATMALKQNDLSIAHTHFEKASQAFVQVLETNPRDSRIQLQLAQTKSWLSELLLAEGQTEQANVLVAEGHVLLEGLVLANPDVNDFRLAYAGLLMNTAARHQQDNRLSDAETLYLEAIEHLRVVREETNHQETPAAQRDLAVALVSLGGLLQQDRLEEAIPLVEESLTILAELRNKFPESIEYRDVEKFASDLLNELNQRK